MISPNPYQMFSLLKPNQTEAQRHHNMKLKTESKEMQRDESFQLFSRNIYTFS